MPLLKLLLELKAAGKVKHFGVSNFSASQFELLQSRLDTPLITNQVEINPINFECVRGWYNGSITTFKSASNGMVMFSGGRYFCF